MTDKDRYNETFETWDKVAKAYQDKFMNLSLYNDTYDFIIQNARSHASILDLGCGPGNITHYLLSKNPNLNIKGIDVSKNMVGLAKLNNPMADFCIMDTRHINKLEDTYDVIICGFCLPYLSQSDCHKLIHDCSKLLNKNGILYISFVEGQYDKSQFIVGKNGDRTFFYYHNKNFIEKELMANSFEKPAYYYKNYLKSDQSKEVHTILITKKIK